MTPEKLQKEDPEKFNNQLIKTRESFQTEALTAELEIIRILQELKNKTGIEYLSLYVFERKVSVETSEQELKKATAKILRPDLKFSSTKETYESEWF